MSNQSRPATTQPEHENIAVILERYTRQASGPSSRMSSRRSIRTRPAHSGDRATKSEASLPMDASSGLGNDAPPHSPDEGTHSGYFGRAQLFGRSPTPESVTSPPQSSTASTRHQGTFSARDLDAFPKSTALERIQARTSSPFTTVEAVPAARTHHNTISTPQSQKSSYFTPKSTSSVAPGISDDQSISKSKRRPTNRRRLSRSSLFTSPRDDEWIEAGTPEAVKLGTKPTLGADDTLESKIDGKMEGLNPRVMLSKHALCHQLTKDSPRVEPSGARKTTWTQRFFGSRNTTPSKGSAFATTTTPGTNQFDVGNEKPTAPIEITGDTPQRVKARSSPMPAENEMGLSNNSTERDEDQALVGGISDDDTLFHLSESSSTDSRTNTPPPRHMGSSVLYKNPKTVGTASCFTGNQSSMSFTGGADARTGGNVTDTSSTVPPSLSTETSVPSTAVPKTTAHLNGIKRDNDRVTDGFGPINYRKHLTPSTIRRLEKRRQERLAKLKASSEPTPERLNLPDKASETREVPGGPNPEIELMDPVAITTQTPKPSLKQRVVPATTEGSDSRPIMPTLVYTKSTPIMPSSQALEVAPDFHIPVFVLAGSPEPIPHRRGMTFSQLSAIIYECMCFVAVHATLANAGQSVDAFQLGCNMGVALICGIVIVIIFNVVGAGVLETMLEDAALAFRAAVGAVFDPMMEWVGRYEER